MSSPATQLAVAPDGTPAFEGTLYIGGQWRAASASRPVLNPADGSEICQVDEASADDVRDAVAAARRTFDAGEWSATPVSERSAILNRVADLLQANRSQIARIETLDTGKTCGRARSMSTT